METEAKTVVKHVCLGLGFTLRLMDPQSESPNFTPQSPNLPLESPFSAIRALG